MGISISTANIGLEWYYRFEDYYYSHDIRMKDIQTDPIEHFPIKKLCGTNVSNI